MLKKPSGTTRSPFLRKNTIRFFAIIFMIKSVKYIAKLVSVFLLLAFSVTQGRMFVNETAEVKEKRETEELKEGERESKGERFHFDSPPHGGFTAGLLPGLQEFRFFSSAFPPTQIRIVRNEAECSVQALYILYCQLKITPSPVS